MMKFIGLVIKAVFVAYLIIFSICNQDSVNFKFFMNTPAYNIPLFLLIIVSIFIGLVLGAAAIYAEKIVVSINNSKLKKEIVRLEKEIERLKKITVTSPENITENNTVSKADENTAKPEENNEIKDVLR